MPQINSNPIPIPASNGTTNSSIQLEDIIIQPHTDWWPPAIGWWLLISFLLVAFSYLLRKWFLKRQFFSAYRQALKKIIWLEKLLNAHEIPATDAVKIIDKILKQLLVNYDKSQKSISLTGIPLKSWIQQHVPIISTALDPLFNEVLYKNKTIENKEAKLLIQAIKPLSKQLIISLKTQSHTR